PLVAEGAGGLLVPLSDGAYMVDVAEKLELPVVLTARSGLGTINHTLLSLEALRRRRVPVAGVVMNGPLNPGNREAIERFGRVRVLAEIPQLEGPPDADAVARLAADLIPPLESVLP
nr:AAA family ATPase [Azospirillaceae bacterium]